ncbi:TetR/AcrR family transcriptional regulator [Plantibacter flavus]|uniref:TetR/AcrR family transcriptional regulator n=1 Tax=Plantibacter flavus TaxID=150123 RepID=UPI003F18C969
MRASPTTADLPLTIRRRGQREPYAENGRKMLNSREETTSIMTAATVRGPYAKSARVREVIVVASLEAFAANGFQATTMAEVARRAGVSHNGLLHHFPTKEDLLLAVITLRDLQIADAIGAVGEHGNDPREILRRATRSIGSPSVELLELDAVLSGEASVADHPAHAALAERFAGIRSFYTRLLAQLRDDDRLLVDVEPAQLATILLATADGLRHKWLFDKNGFDVGVAVDTFLDMIISPGKPAEAATLPSQTE